MQRPIDKYRQIALPVCRALAAGALSLTLFASPMACVWRTEHKIETVSKIDAHIVLDIRQIKDEASDIEGYVRDSSAPPSANPAATPAPSAETKPLSWAETQMGLRERAARASRGSWFSFSPRAQGAELPDVSKEDEAKAVEARKGRAKTIDAALSAGQLGENNLGFVEPILPKDAPGQARDAAAALAKMENADRKTIYTAIAKRHGKLPEDLPMIGMVYSSIIREQMKKGQTYQAPKNPELFKDYQSTEVGKAAPDAKPDAWVVKTIDPPKKKEG